MVKIQQIIEEKVVLLLVLTRGVRGPDWVGFDQNQNPNHIRYYGLGLVK
jgi:hypothetical protein